MTFLGCIALFLTALLVIALITYFTEGRRLAQVEQQFHVKRKPLADSAYLKRLPTCKSASFQIGARKAMARLCGTAPEMIHPTDSMRLLMDLQFDRGFIDDFISFTEQETGRRVDLSAIPEPEEYDFAEYVEQLVVS